MNCDYRTIKSPIEYEENLANIEEKIAAIDDDGPQLSCTLGTEGEGEVEKNFRVGGRKTY